jgi:UDP-N-acetylglucosamine 2-epimerase (non-hydrolysing)
MQNAENLYKEGVGEHKVFVTGNTVIDTLLDMVKRKTRTFDQHIPEGILNGNRMILVTAHRRENWGKPIEDLCFALKDLVCSYPDVFVVYPVHLNPNVRNTVFSLLGGEERIFLLDPLPYAPFIEAMGQAYLIITDSGGVQEEGPSLGKPILVFRETTERPEGLATKGVKLIGLRKQNVSYEASLLLDSPSAYRQMIADHNPCGDGQASERILQAIRFNFGMGDRPHQFPA